MAVTSPQIYAWLERYAGIVAEQKQYLTGLDAAIGDGAPGWSAMPASWPSRSNT